MYQHCIASNESKDIEIQKQFDINRNLDTNISDTISTVNRYDEIPIVKSNGNSFRRKDEELLFDEPVDESINKKVMTKISPINKVNTDEIVRMKKKRKSLFGNMNFQTYKNDIHDFNNDNNNDHNNNVVHTNITKSPLNYSDME
jgi:hypothetical protein